MKAFIVADAHGRHDMIEGLLEQEGLLGAGRGGVLTVQIGDLCNCVTRSIDDDIECLARAPGWFDVVLIGNHELPYFGGPSFGGFWRDPQIASMLLNYGTEGGLIRPALAVDGVLITHAGVTPELRAHDTARGEADRLARQWQEDKRLPVFSAIGEKRGGRGVGGIFWSDWDDPKADGYSQVVGHTVGRDVRWRMHDNGNWAVCIDAGASREVQGPLTGLWLEDGVPRVVQYERKRKGHVVEAEESAAREALEKIAESAAKDIAADFPAVDTSYDTYMQRLVTRAPVWPYAKQRLVGVIDMGDLYMEAFVWEDGEWERESASPHEVLDAILRERGVV